MPTKLQKLARARNHKKFRISGGNIPQDYEGLTLYEKERLKYAQRILDQLLERWDDRSKQLGLNPGSHK